MSWATGLILWLLFGIGALWLFAEVSSRFSKPSDDWDWVADKKRRTARRARHQSREFK
jgi:hypothetical protein